MNDVTDPWAGCPAWIKSVAERDLADGEAPLAWFEPDLDAGLRYTPGLVVLTAKRILSYEWEAETARDSRGEVAPKERKSWDLKTGAELRVRDHAGVARLELCDESSCLASWRYTVARSPGAHRLADRLDSLRRGLPPPKTALAVAEQTTTECEICGATFLAELTACPDCGNSQARPPVRALARLASFLRNHVGMTLLGLVLSLLSTGVGLIPPYLTMPLLDKVLIPYQSGAPADFGMVRWYLLGLAGASVAAWLLSWAQGYVLSWVSERVSADLRMRTYAHLQQLSLEYFGGKRTGDLIARVGSDTDRICYYLSVYLLDFITDVLMIAMMSVILLKIDFSLAVVTLLPMPLIAALVFKAQGRLRRGFSFGTRAWGELTAILADTIPGIRVVKAFAQERREIERFGEANDRVLHANDRVNRLFTLFYALVVLLTDLGVLVVWLFGVWRVFHHSVTVGVLTAFVAYITRFYTRLDSMSRIVAATQRAGAGAQRIFAILDRVPKVPEPATPVHPGRLDGSIELRRVGFRYGARPVLHGIDLAIRPGELIGLVGPSGSGKTTMINLLCRFYDVTEGAIVVDGHDVRSFPIAEYRRSVGLVLQEPFLFYGTIADNIAYGRPGATREEIISAARAARAHEFILRQPNGYDSLVGERGQLLSGGERQRISIARALLIDPRILILDEATSSVDTETEREIQMALANLIKGRTTIAIAHRLSTLQRADRLVVLERGEITEIGTHSELLERSGAYARLYQAQIRMQAAEEETE
jgi:ATP-binding cassette subfamily B protein